MNVYDLLKTEAGLSRVEVDKYFVVTEKDKETVLKLRGKAWLEAKTYAAMQELVKKTGGSYTPTPPTFTVPLGAVGSNPTPAKPTHEETKNAEPEPAPEEGGYSLAASKEGLGELAPVLKDAFGNIIDGFHRKGENASWHEVTVGHIDNPVKLELARLAVNFCRRRVPPEELKQRIAFLIGKGGLKPEDIAAKTGIGLRTVQKYTPQEFKNQTYVEMGRQSAAARVQRTANLTEQETETEELPRGTEAPTFPGMEQSYLQELVKCDKCRLLVHRSRITQIDEENVCPHCQEKTCPPPSPQAIETGTETSEPPHEEPNQTKPVKEIDYTAQGYCCPICSHVVNKNVYESMKRKFAQYPELFSFSEETA